MLLPLVLFGHERGILLLDSCYSLCLAPLGRPSCLHLHCQRCLSRSRLTRSCCSLPECAIRQHLIECATRLHLLECAVRQHCPTLLPPLLPVLATPSPARLPTRLVVD